MKTADVAVVGEDRRDPSRPRAWPPGASVLLFDHTHPREKPCGGGISASARRAFPEIEELVPLGKTGTRLRIAAPSGRTVSVTGDGATFAIDRAVFDAALFDRAVKLGATPIRERVSNLRRDDGAWVLETGSGPRCARVMIGADGVASLVRRRLIGRADLKHAALGAHVLVDRLESPSALVRFFGDRRGYAWVFNRRERSSIGVGMPLDRRNGWQLALAKFFTEQAPGRAMPPVVSWTLPLARGEEAFAERMAGDDWCVVGDAAGHVDPLTGEGIYYAMWGAEIAAQCVLAGRPGDYEPRWREAYLPVFLRHARTARHLEHRRRIELLVAAGSVPFLGRRIYASMTSG
ncbi:MAG: NAD(P)/FAD-dependent oxidoreductase [Deltaproteobacteria bacterium]|nr:NAD(P)/FAD-dependent oxidoreductase [Deltaproteobacteria bacterium]